MHRPAASVVECAEVVESVEVLNTDRRVDAAYSSENQPGTVHRTTACQSRMAARRANGGQAAGSRVTRPRRARGLRAEAVTSATSAPPLRRRCGSGRAGRAAVGAEVPAVALGVADA